MVITNSQKYHLNATRKQIIFLSSRCFHSKWSPGRAYSRLCSNSATSWGQVGVARVWVHAKLLQSCLTLSMRFSRPEYWSGLLCPPSGYLLDPGIEPVSLTSPVLAGGAPWKHQGSTLGKLPPGKPESSTVEWKRVTCGENQVLNTVKRSTSNFWVSVHTIGSENPLLQTA